MKIYLGESDQQTRFEEHLATVDDCLRRQDYERALEHYEKILTNLQGTPEMDGVEDQKAAVRNARADLLMQLGRWDQAMEDIDRVLGAGEGRFKDVGLTTQALLSSAQISSYYGDFAESVSTLERALELLGAEGYRADRARIMVELGSVYAKIGEVQQGRAKLKAVENLLSPVDGLSAEEALALASAYTQSGLMAFRERKIADAREYYQKSLGLCEKQESATKLQADTLRYLGILANVQGQNIEALEYHHRALKLYADLRLLLGQAKTYSSIGQTCLDLSRLDEALFFTQKAEMLSRRLGAEAEVAAVYGKLGNIYVQMGDYTRAAEFHLKDVEMCRRFGNYRAIAYAMHNLGLSYRGKGDIEEALHYLKESLLRFEELGDKLHCARLYLDLARTYLDRSRLSEAEEQIEEAVKHLEAVGEGPEYGYARLLAGTLYRLWQDYETAENSLKEAVRLLSPHGTSPKLAQTHFELGMLYVDLGDSKNALENLKACLRLARRLEMRNLMLDSVSQIERLDELELVKLLLEDLVANPGAPTAKVVPDAESFQPRN